MRCTAAEASIAPWVDGLSAQRADVRTRGLLTSICFGLLVSLSDNIRRFRARSTDNSLEGYRR